MSASAINNQDRGLAIETGDSCKIVVFYENNVARAGAMSVCERLADQFAEDLDFEFKWWKSKRLLDPGMAQNAIAAAMAADIVMFCPQGFELSPEVANWLEVWAESGVKSGGAIALVMSGRPDPTGMAVRLTSTFKWAAQRLGTDFLQVTVPVLVEPQVMSAKEIPLAMPSVERPHVYHWGLNE